MIFEANLVMSLELVSTFEGHDGNHEGATLFCQAFPGVRHVDVHVDHTFFFEPSDDMMLPPPMDNWKTRDFGS